MRLFGGRPRTAMPASVLTSLPAFGDAALDARAAGRPVNDPRFDWESFLGPATSAYRVAGTEKATSEIVEAVSSGPGRESAILGAYSLLAEIDPESRDPRYLSLIDEVLELLRTRRFSSGHLSRYEADRWVETHGELRSSFDGIYEVEVPDPGAQPAATSLEPGTSRVLATTGPPPEGNSFFAERSPDGSYLVFSERLKSDDEPVRMRYEEPQLGTFDSLEELLRALGAMFGTRPYWADPELDPYFPRRRSGSS